ncbi:MAG: hypothetical protein OXH38_02415 [Chloroflexi bacterium]|nr:hypothetical protein [Chloroflexota bacterium]
MSETLKRQVTVQAGGKLEFVCPELEAGQTVEVIVHHEPVKPRRSAWEIINDGPRERLFKTAKEVDDYLAEERASWDR